MSTTDLSGFDGETLAWVPRGPRRRRAWRLPRITLMDVGLVCGVALVGALVLASLLPAPDTHRAPPPPPAAAALPIWIDIVRPLQLYDLSGSLFAKLPLAYGARRRPVGVERQDTLSFGTFGGTTPYLTLLIMRRPETSPLPEADLVVDLARAAAGDGIALVRAVLPTPLPTRFGSFSVADVALRRGGVALPCLGFRLDTRSDRPQSVAISGLACGGAERPDRMDLACAIERIDLVSAGDDTTLRDFFVEAERRRGHVCDTAKAARMGSTT